ncbi:MAG: bacteriophage holin [Candidatus Acidiferrales bacterium]
MRLSLKAITLAGALLWGSAILLVGSINLMSPGYGLTFLQMTSSVYPGFHASHTIGSVIIGTIDGLVDGAVAALLFAWLYNSFSRIPSHT